MSDSLVAKSRRIDPNAFRRATILVAEGDRAMRRTLRDVLLGMGFPSIVLAGTMAEAMRQIIEQRPSVILLDQKLPGGDNLTLPRRLRRENDDLPIILMAQAPDTALVAAARDAGVDEIVVKPLSMESLILRLMAVLKAQRPFVRSRTYLGPDRRRLPERRRTERRAQGPFSLDSDRRQHGRRSGDDRRRGKSVP